MNDRLIVILVLALVVVVVVVAAVAVVVAIRRGARPQRPVTGVAPVAVRPTLADRLTKTRQALGGRISALMSRDRLDEEFWQGLEEALIAADVGALAASEIVDRVRAGECRVPADARHGLSDELRRLLAGRDRTLRQIGKPAVYVIVGVNGSGKTTSIAKLAARMKAEGRQPLLGAADTFRAAADTQLRTWSERVGVEMVGGEPGADAAAVAFDAYQAARARGRDVVIVDTAGRLHSEHNLMQELGKVVRVLEREAGVIDEVLLVLDATTGQNGIAQAKAFAAAAGLTGIVLAKMDGTARGGVVVAVEKEFGIPVKLIGVGEAIEDLVSFDPDAFVDALLGP